MKSFNGSQEHYEAWGRRLKDHADRDELIQDTGWDNGKGCFIGCSVHQYSHKKFAKLFDVPVVIPRLADTLFENADKSEATGFALAIWESMQVGVDYSKFTHYWHHWLVSDLEQGVVRFNNHPDINAVGLLHLKAQTELVPQEEWMKSLTKVHTVHTEASADFADFAAAVACFAADAANDSRLAAAASAEAFAHAARVAYFAARVINSPAASADAADAADAADVAAVGGREARAQQRVKFLELLASPVFPKVN